MSLLVKGVSSFLGLTDAPHSYSGQGLKLVKVNSGETACVFDLLLTFTDWYSGGAPTDFPWVYEANLPFDKGSYHYFSPLRKDTISGEYYCYVSGDAATKFYRYNITTKQWYKLANPPETVYGAIALSPDGNKLACHGVNGTKLDIYDIGTNTWTQTAAAPQISGADIGIQSTVWADNDTVWCHVRAYVGATWHVRCYRYVVSTATWTQFAGDITPAVTNSQGMSIKTDGSALYFGQCGANYYALQRYTIATDTYSEISLGSTGRYFLYASDRNARLWWHSDPHGPTSYFNCDTETLVTNVFPTNSQEDKPSNWAYGFYGTTGCIEHARVNEPVTMSYFGTGTWKLTERTLTDYTMVVFRKPADGYPILAIDKTNGFTIPMYIFDTVTLPAGTWEFFYSKDGDYTKLKISGSPLK